MVSEDKRETGEISGFRLEVRKMKILRKVFRNPLAYLLLSQPEKKKEKRKRKLAKVFKNKSVSDWIKNVTTFMVQ